MIFSSCQTCYINGRSKSAPHTLAFQLRFLMESLCSPNHPPVFVCIGSDRVTGDSLGPLVGTTLYHSADFPFPVYGTLHQPIHALNLDTTVSMIKYRHPGCPIVAIDASLGTRRHQQYITICKGSLQPGAGVDKDLIEVGDIAITGIINVSGRYSQTALQNTRLANVMSLANSICQGILLACSASASKTACTKKGCEIQSL